MPLMTLKTPEIRISAHRGLGAIVATLLCIGCSAPAPEVVGPSLATTAAPSASVTPATLPSPVVTDSAVSPRTRSAAEQQLLAGIRADLVAVGCRPLDGELPVAATAGVGCDVGSDLVERARFYQFDSMDALMAVYESHFAQYGVPLATDAPDIRQPPRDCWRDYASESLYWPTGDELGGMNREGCFINEDGFANLRYVWGSPLVFVEVLGNSGDIPALKAWSWYDEAGDEPASGGPGLWQPPR